MHIIRRNVKVINTDGEKKEVEQITTDISGSIKSLIILQIILTKLDRIKETLTRTHHMQIDKTE